MAAAAADDRQEVIRTARRRTVFAVGAAGLLWLLSSCLFTVDVTEHAVLSRFGEVRHVFDQQAGLHVKLPIDTVLRFDKRIVYSEPKQGEYLSLDKKNVVIESLATWRIADPRRYLESLGNRAAADARLAEIVAAQIGAVIGRHPAQALISIDGSGRGQQSIVRDIGDAVARFALSAYGVQVIDVALTRLTLPERNRVSVFERMKAERGKIAMEYRSAGELESKRIIGQADREVSDIASNAYAQAQRLRAEGDAQAARIYSDAFVEEPAFYKFLRTLQAYEKVLDPSTTLFLPAGAELFEMLRGQDKTGAAPAATATAAARPSPFTAPLANPGQTDPRRAAAPANTRVP